MTCFNGGIDVFCRMIKGKNPYPFETIALAVSFSPGLPILVTEMKRMCELHKSLAVFIHVGKKTSEKQRELALLLTSNGFHDGNSRIYWEQVDIVSSILQICKHEVVDLIIVGASEKENFALPIGQIAANIATKAKCSVLVFTDSGAGSFKKIIVNGIEHKKTDLTILTSIYFAEKENSESIFISDDSGVSSYEDRSNDNIPPTLKKDLFIFKGAIENSKVKINLFSLSGEQCDSISDYAFKNNADLIVTHSSEHMLLIFDRISSHDGIDALLKKLPCNLLVVHSRLIE